MEYRFISFQADLTWLKIVRFTFDICYDFNRRNARNPWHHFPLRYDEKKKQTFEILNISHFLMIFQTLRGSKAIKFYGHCGVLSSPRGDRRSSRITLYLFRK